MIKKDFPILTYTLTVLRFHQLWPKEGKALNTEKFSQFKHSLPFLLFFTFLYTSGIALHLFRALIYDLNVDTAEDLSVLVSSVGVFIVLTNYTLNQQRIAHLYKDLSDFRIFGKPDGFEENYKRGEFLSNLFHKYCLLGFVIYAIFPIIDAPMCRKMKESDEICGLFLPAWFPFNVQDFPLLQIIFFLQFCCAFMIIIPAANIAMANYQVSQYISLRINQLNSCWEKVFQSRSIKKQREQFNFCLRYHRFIINLYERFDESFAIGNGCYFFMSAIIFGCILNQLTKEASPRAIVHLFGWVIAVYLNCIVGQTLISKSLTIADAVYASRWYNCEAEMQRNLVMVLRRAQKPFLYHAKPFGILSYPVFVTLLKTSYSYFTLLNKKK